ncbi:hypothetical protein [Streptomyces sp. Isolate_219]|uniref:hypothetical protein n=1 Tax=Streptomyces sp. Isolate_219 TaxID=2950110 RepID=UPI0021C7FC62|nr:hypothetical protein [Streptomyces sp. Isolate_219]MCR8576468.1 hypothetical protein [Streptomyces sp. Isolate_219]
MSLLTMQSVVVLRAPLVVDPYGNPSTERDWGNATSTPYDGVSVQPDASTEATGDRATIVTGWRLFTDRWVDIDLLPTDRVQYDGMTLEVDGEVARYHRGGRTHHVEARLKRVVG